MKYSEFKKLYTKTPLILTRDLHKTFDNKQIGLNQIYRWYKKELIYKLKKGIYLLNEADRKVNPSRMFLSAQLYTPSYISMEYALAYYGLIPEAVHVVTAITTRKTLKFENSEGLFFYQHIKTEAFQGYKVIKDEAGLPYYLATPEKALADFLYLNLSGISVKNNQDIFQESYRFQNVGIMNLKKFMDYIKLFRNKKLKKIALSFCEYKVSY